MKFDSRRKIELLQQHRKTCEVCWYVPIDHSRDFCPIGRMLAEDIAYPIRVVSTGPVSRWWRFCSWLGRGLARVI